MGVKIKDSQLWIEASKLIQSFKKLGFITLDSFVNIVQEKDTHYRGYESQLQLYRFWKLQEKNHFLNKDLNKILEQLKAE